MNAFLDGLELTEVTLYKVADFATYLSRRQTERCERFFVEFKVFPQEKVIYYSLRERDILVVSCKIEYGEEFAPAIVSALNHLDAQAFGETNEELMYAFIVRVHISQNEESISAMYSVYTERLYRPLRPLFEDRIFACSVPKSPNYTVPFYNIAHPAREIIQLYKSDAYAFVTLPTYLNTFIARSLYMLSINKDATDAERQVFTFASRIFGAFVKTLCRNVLWHLAPKSIAIPRIRVSIRTWKGKRK